MPKQGELDYIRLIGASGVDHAVRKPFSCDDCGRNLGEMGSIFCLLPPLPARLLDLGVGTGWTSIMFAERGYDVVGQDIAPDMIDLANQNKARARLSNVRFVVSDYESLGMPGEFDAAVFYDSLHHSVDETAALRCVYRALKPGGICITSEPGEGHEENPHTRQAVKLYGVTEKDMPPHHIAKVGAAVGFRSYRVYQRFNAPRRLHDSTEPPPAPPSRVGQAWAHFKAVARTLLWGIPPAAEVPPFMRQGNIVVLQK